MIIVTGSVTARSDSLSELLAASLAHVHRSRLEPGCLSHAVHVDAENPLRLVFLEEWEDHAALMAHFKVPESLAFVAKLPSLAATPPVLNIFSAEKVPAPVG